MLLNLGVVVATLAAADPSVAQNINLVDLDLVPKFGYLSRSVPRYTCTIFKKKIHVVRDIF